MHAETVATAYTKLSVTVGDAWSSFTDHPCTQLELVNSTGGPIEYQRKNGGRGTVLESGTVLVVYGITNASEVRVRRVGFAFGDTSSVIVAEAFA